METTPLQQTPNTYSDEATVNLLTRPEIQTGIVDVAAATAAYYHELQKQGTQVERVASGVTGRGTCVEAARLTSPADETSYSVFVYPLEAVAQRDFSVSLTPRTVITAKERGDMTELALADPARDSTHGHTNLLSPDGNDTIVDTEGMPKTQTLRFFRGQTYLAGRPVRSFAEAAFGDRRREIVETETGPLLKAAERYAHSLSSDQRQALGDVQVMRALHKEHPHDAAVKKVLDEVETELTARTAKREAAGQRLQTLAATIMRNALRDPASIDIPGLVHNPEKAEAMAHAAATHMDGAQKAFRRKSRRAHQARADEEANWEATNYDRKLRHPNS